MINTNEKNDLVFFDLETNGLETDTAILEIAAIRYKAGQFIEKEEFEHLVYFEGPLNIKASAVHNIGSDSLRMYGRDIKEVLTLFREFSSGAVLVGQNCINFDLRILNYHLWKYSLSLSCLGVFDTKRMAEQLLSLPDYRLSTLAAHFNCPQSSYHRAMTDVRATVGVFQGLISLGKAS